MPTRPLSPFATIYRRTHSMVLSFAHRITGVAQAVGLALLAYWLMALSAGEAAYNDARDLLGQSWVKVLLAAWLLAFVYHLCNGVRHLFWDAGVGLEKAEARRSAIVVVAVALLLFGFFLWRGFLAGGAL